MTKLGFENCLDKSRPRTKRGRSRWSLAVRKTSLGIIEAVPAPHDCFDSRDRKVCERTNEAKHEDAAPQLGYGYITCTCGPANQ
jgi:hypothetical protein